MDLKLVGLVTRGALVHQLCRHNHRLVIGSNELLLEGGDFNLKEKNDRDKIKNAGFNNYIIAWIRKGNNFT